jgi:hypothetical protein
MIKRSESKQHSSRRRRSDRATKNRRLKMEGLEKRELLAVLTEPPTQAPPELEEYTESRNIGAVQSFLVIESETLIQTGLNDIPSNSDFIPLGTGPGQQDTIDITGTLPVSLSSPNGSGFSSDIDTYSFDLRGGDILDAATLGAAGGVTIRDSNGSILVGSDLFITFEQFPIQSVGNANSVVVIPEDGRYFVTISPAPVDTTANYSLGLRVYRPTTEQLGIGDMQIPISILLAT